jgi:NAD(P)-dependent dehydrogenase (short-subunit alcohol dehydrogenase family)
MELRNKVALVTGAGSGIGKAAALRLAREGAAIGVLSHTDDEVSACVQEIERAGGAAGTKSHGQPSEGLRFPRPVNTLATQIEDATKNRTQSGT